MVLDVWLTPYVLDLVRTETKYAANTVCTAKSENIMYVDTGSIYATLYKYLLNVNNRDNMQQQVLRRR